ncbi:MAG: methyltransferase domain-containing protein [Verrucomicrobia bacterium]|nr:methyltransferase domain-containing protein [Verrucomicrobiota bacterium]
MIPMRPTELAHRIVREVLCEGAHAVDATAGNGHDTCVLAEAVGASGRVTAFDVQQAAIDATRHRLASAGLLDRVDLVCDSHLHIARRVAAGNVSAVMFNLGYLPGGDHSLITRAADTDAAIVAACGLLCRGGVITVVCYPGHPGGGEEAASVAERMRVLTGDGWRIGSQTPVGTRRPSPVLWFAKRADAG